jgi:ribose transport system ATP-binding protein
MTFPGQKALDNVDLEVRSGEIHALLGQNGCGKSTLIKVLTGYHRPDPGVKYWLSGSPAKLARGGLVSHDGKQLEIRAVHQDLGLVEKLNAVDNIALVAGFCESKGGTVSWSKQERLTRNLLARVGGADIDIREPLARCDPLHRTLVAVARVLAGWKADSGLLILDEPTAPLQAEHVDRLFGVIDGLRSREKQQQDISIIYVSHRLPEIFRISDRLTVLRGGKVVANRTTSAVNHDQLVGLMLGEAAEEMVSRHGRPDPRPAVSETGQRPRCVVRNLRAATIEDLSFSIRPGEILGFAGVVGSGVEQLPYLLAGAAPSAAGSLQIDDEQVDLAKLTPRRARQLGIALVPADRPREGLVLTSTIRDNITLGVLRQFQRRGWLIDSRETQFARSWGARLDLSPNDPSRPVKLLSGGNAQKVSIGKSLAVSKNLLLLAEPTVGVDVGAKNLIYEYLRRESIDSGTPMIVCSSDTLDFTSLCTRVLILNHGRIAHEFSGIEISENNLLRAVLKPEESTDD